MQSPLCLVGLLLLLLGTGSSAARRKLAHRSSGKATSSGGEVDLLYNWGSPGSASPGFRNGGGCFPGLRVVTKRWAWYGRKEIDIIPPSGRQFGFEHPVMDLLELDVATEDNIFSSCAGDLVGLPEAVGRPGLHDRFLYMRKLKEKNPEDKWLIDMSHFGCNTSFAKTDAEARWEVERLGWRLVTSAFHEGDFRGGAQVSYLIQHPVTLDCVVTFQGTQSFNDWLSNFDTSKVEFCGLSSQVHKGFRDHLMQMITSQDWQTKMRWKLPQCSRVIATGHSLGAALAELFAACVQNAPQIIEDPRYDYFFMGWNKSTPALLA